ncbi:hypothetical protein, partial [Stenotrophomonas maltophilia]|uniref:hypothetical protein n=1 Tax=Stenotrophomonas maltophilia TaxID=40324 RepID=UPI0039C3A452
APMVVWLKPCESRSSPGFIPKNPAAHAAGFFLLMKALHFPGGFRPKGKIAKLAPQALLQPSPW